jgi:hypothetical protein
MSDVSETQKLAQSHAIFPTMPARVGGALLSMRALGIRSVAIMIR